MSQNKNRRRENPQSVTSTAATVAEKIPLVSVVMPMFNAAKFVSQTLESLLYQTMTNFEVVIVDDCSTDNSIEVVESFRERFGGRLKLVKLPKNTGTPGLPRNVGIQLARGKYIAFLDCDDLYTKTALEELSTLAEKFQADVVHTDGTFNLWGNKPKAEDDSEMTDMDALLNRSNPIIWRPPAAPVLKEPTFEPQNFQTRLDLWLKFGYRWAVSSSFVKRDFLAANQICFADILGAEDMLFNFNILCVAEKILRVPNVTYIIRPRAGSISREKQSVDVSQHLHKWLSVMVDGTKIFEEIMSRVNFFAERPDYRYAVIDFFFQDALHEVPRIYAQIPAFKLNELVKPEFHPDDASLAAYLFNTVNVYRLQIMKLQHELAALKQQS